MFKDRELQIIMEMCDVDIEVEEDHREWLDPEDIEQSVQRVIDLQRIKRKARLYMKH